MVRKVSNVSKVSHTTRTGQWVLPIKKNLEHNRSDAMNTLKTILTTIIFFGGITFAQDEAVEAVSSWNGEFSTDITFGDTVSFGSAYTGISYSGEGWKLTSHLSEGGVNVEEAYYNVDAKYTSVTLGQQMVPFGIANHWHRPSANPFVSEPSSQAYAVGLGASTEFAGVGIAGFYGDNQSYSMRASYGLVGHTAGVSINSDEARLLDASGEFSYDSFGSISSYFEYDLSEETSGDLWYRAVISPSFTKGITALVGYSSVGDETETMYGVGYHYDNSYIRTELSADGDVSVRVSYTF